ncbi:hypothetical protein DMA11_12945 [Marinilabiliaceae bacterium JC017]|nr:hypothetical protein DMA11_12945 [Marinilabiliaceae bacterium JC017]
MPFYWLFPLSSTSLKGYLCCLKTPLPGIKTEIMDRYLDQLIEDIHKARTIVRPPSEIWNDADMEDEGEMEDMAFVEEYLYGEPKPLYEITGIATELLPLPDQLNEAQTIRLVTELEDLLAHYHFVADFPETFPVQERYPFLLDIWDDEYVELSFGDTHIEFCSYEEENCPFPGYCNICKEVAQQIKIDEQKGKNLLDDDAILPF